jgi:membrane protease YdiL (CAAX protease family)
VKTLLTGFAVIVHLESKEGKKTIMNHKSQPMKEVVLFFAITLGLALVFWGPLVLFQVPTISFVGDVKGPVWAIILFMLNGFGPSVVAIVLTWVRGGKIGLKQFLKRVIQFNIGWQWYLAAIAVVVLPTLGQLLIIRMLGQSFNYMGFITQLGSFIPLIIIGPLSEELGWRGYALERLQTKWSALVSSIVVGTLWALWHLPLFYMVGTSQHELHLSFISFMAGLIALSILFTWLNNNTDHSIWTAVFFHWLFTYSGQVVASYVTRSPLYNWLEYSPYILVALIVAIMWGPRTLQKNQAGTKPHYPLG